MVERIKRRRKLGAVDRGYSPEADRELLWEQLAEVNDSALQEQVGAVVDAVLDGVILLRRHSVVDRSIIAAGKWPGMVTFDVVVKGFDRGFNAHITRLFSHIQGAKYVSLGFATSDDMRGKDDSNFVKRSYGEDATHIASIPNREVPVVSPTE